MDKEEALRQAFKAVSRGDGDDLARLLLDRRFGIDKQDEFEGGLLHLAASRSNPTTVKMLLAAGADPNSKGPFKRTPLHQAAFFARGPDCIEALLDAGADPMSADGDGCLPLHFAALNGDAACVEILAAASLESLDFRSNSGTTAAMSAVVYGKPEALETLIRAGADISIPDNIGATPLHEAAAGGQIDCLEVLIRCGAPIDAIDALGDSPLHSAADNGRRACLAALLSAGADATIRNKHGRSALDVADKASQCHAVLSAHTQRKELSEATPTARLQSKASKSL